MKILTVCEYGINRSVAARWLLQHEGHEVIPVGVVPTSAATLEMLYDWADFIIVLDASLLEQVHVPAAREADVIVWDVGSDAQFPHHLNTNLIRQIRALWLRDESKFDSGPRI